MRLIDADFVKQRMNQTMDYQDLYLPIHFEQVLDDAPTLSPDDVRGVGKWVKNHDEVMWWWECSNCKEKPLISRFGDAEVLSAYCPRCGAKLEIPEGE